MNGWLDDFGVWGSLSVALSVPVVHELGHLATAQLLGTRIRYTSVGLGRPIWRRSLERHSDLRPRAFPVSLGAGRDAARDAAGNLRRPLVHAMAVTASGPLANILSVVLLLATGLLLRGAQTVGSWYVSAAAFSTLLELVYLVPLPGLDGGHRVMPTLSALGLRCSGERQATVHRVGLRVGAVLCAIMALVSVGRSVWGR